QVLYLLATPSTLSNWSVYYDIHYNVLLYPIARYAVPFTFVPGNDLSHRANGLIVTSVVRQMNRGCPRPSTIIPKSSGFGSGLSCACLHLDCRRRLGAATAEQIASIYCAFDGFRTLV
ncbi:MAG: hypothetical protein WBX30_15480, partial [Stellaceae bacterium]